VEQGARVPPSTLRSAIWIISWNRLG